MIYTCTFQHQARLAQGRFAKQKALNSRPDLETFRTIAGEIITVLLQSRAICTIIGMSKDEYLFWSYSDL